MPSPIIVVEDLADWKADSEVQPTVHVDDYLTGSEYHRLKNARVINLCRSYDYQSVGYYCSLLAEARRHRVIPTVRTMLDLGGKSMYGLDAERLSELVGENVGEIESGVMVTSFELDVYFGRTRSEPFAEFARHLFDAFPCPILRVGFRRSDHNWIVSTIRPLFPHKLEPKKRRFFDQTLDRWLQRRWRSPRAKSQTRYDIAILHTRDQLGPSNEGAIRQFLEAGKKLKVNAEVIGAKDYPHLAEYDALFIRDTTHIKHYTYRFSQRAEAEGMVVIDDPSSILRCTNKVYLAELLRTHRVPAPKTVIMGATDVDAAEAAIGYPMVLKIPDGSFSRGVVRVETPAELRKSAKRLLRTTDLILAQEYVYTEFDWRIGILNRQPIYACKYFMSERHWQIMHHMSDGSYKEGRTQTIPISEVPPGLLAIALKAANLIGDGLYGVDLKQTKNGVRVIEINDNPSIDAGFEDQVLKDEIYLKVMAEIVRRLDQRHGVEMNNASKEGRTHT